MFSGIQKPVSSGWNIAYLNTDAVLPFILFLAWLDILSSAQKQSLSSHPFVASSSLAPFRYKPAHPIHWWPPPPQPPHVVGLGLFVNHWILQLSTVLYRSHNYSSRGVRLPRCRANVERELPSMTLHCTAYQLLRLK